MTLVCWGFDIEKLTEAYDYPYTVGIYKALLEGFGELAKSKNKRQCECYFTVWRGDILWNFWVGVPDSLPDTTLEVLDRHLKPVTGYYSKKFGETEAFRLDVRFAYDHGRVIQYCDDSVAGEERPDAYGSGVTVNYRLLCL